MKKIKYFAHSLILAFCFSSCGQEVIDLQPMENPQTPACPSDATAGSADFSKFITIGNSFVAGVQGGALFTTGQDNSLGAILNKQFECVGAPETFNQPSIKASLGYNLFVTQPILTDPTKPVLGRLLLEYGTDPDCETGEISAAPSPQAYAPGELEALPNPALNPGFIYTGSKTSLNNFGFPALTLGQFLTPATGNWADPDPSKGFSPFYARLAYPPTGSTVIGDAAAAGGTFFLFWAGLDDFFLYAAFGGDPTKAPKPMNKATFQYLYSAALNPTNGLLASNPNLKGVVGNFPDIFKMPHFTAVAYNPIPLDETTATQLTAGFAGYNTVIGALITFKDVLGISNELAAELATRTVSFEASCHNKILMKDEGLVDIGPYLDALVTAGKLSPTDRAKLTPYQQVRQTTSTDVIPLSTGSVLGEPGSFGVLGVSEPVGDRYVITPTEKEEINTARTNYNEVVASFANDNSTRVALADVSAGFENFTTLKVIDGVAVTPNINPPTGIYSEDGVHPNTRGYAWLANIFIDAINSRFGAKIPPAKLSNYGATGLPL